jgi:uncharacterized protein (DUF1697 family)
MRATPGPHRYAAFLRGINIGANKRVAMADLRDVATRLGYEDVATHLNSGNLVLSAPGDENSLAEELEQAIAGRFGFAVPLVLRGREQLSGVLRRDPLAALVDNGSRYAVALCGATVPSALADAALAADAGRGWVQVHGREVYVWCPNGLSKSAPIEVLARPRKDVVVTIRNWNTLQAVARMLGEPRG